jgi:sortase A
MSGTHKAVGRDDSRVRPSRLHATVSHCRVASRKVVRAARWLVFLTAACLLVWTLVVWQWQDPFTALYTRQQQKSLASAYERAESTWRREMRAAPGTAKSDLRPIATRYRQSLERGDPVGRLVVPRLGLDLMVANGSDPATLRKGPGRDRRSFVPGEGELVYLAGHRTTYLAPFSRIDVLRPGDRITVAVPYGTFVYAVTGRKVVSASDVSVLRSPGREALALQTCHPRFFASKRYVVFARLARGGFTTARDQRARRRTPSGPLRPRATALTGVTA